MFFEAVVHQLDDEVFLAEDIDEFGGGGAGLVEFVLHEELWDDGGEAAGEGDEALAVFGEGFEVGAGVAVEALGVGLGDQFAEVLVALEILGEQAHVPGFLLGAAFVAVGQLVLVDEVDLAAEEGLDAVFVGLFEEGGEAVEDAVVGDGEGLHAQFGGPLAEPVRACAPVQQAVVGVDVKVDEFGVFGGHGALRLRLPRRVARRSCSQPADYSGVMCAAVLSGGGGSAGAGVLSAAWRGAPALRRGSAA